MTIDALYAAHPELYSAEHDGRASGRSGGSGSSACSSPGRSAPSSASSRASSRRRSSRPSRPAVLHLVDPWWLAYGDVYPDWGAYTARGTLPTARRPRSRRDARGGGARRLRGAGPRVHVGRLAAQPARRVARLGRISTRRTSTKRRSRSFACSAASCARTASCSATTGSRIRRTPHHGVFRAVHELVREGMWDVVRADEQIQWALRPAVEVPSRRALSAGIPQPHKPPAQAVDPDLDLRRFATGPLPTRRSAGGTVSPDGCNRDTRDGEARRARPQRG